MSGLKEGDEVFIKETMEKDTIRLISTHYFRLLNRFVTDIFLMNRSKEITTSYKRDELIKVSDYREERLAKILDNHDSDY